VGVPGSDPGTTVAPDAAGGPPATTAPAPAAPPAPPPPPRRILAVGDSVMLGAAPALQATLQGSTFVDAKVGRQVSECLQILQGWHDHGLLGDVVIIHIGNNGTFAPEQFEQMKQLLAGVPEVIFLNNKVPRGWEEGNNEVIANGVASMPNAKLIDWKTVSSPHPELFYNDGMHLRPAGQTFYANLVNGTL
jgi:hypothetical protein